MSGADAPHGPPCADQRHRPSEPRFRSAAAVHEDGGASSAARVVSRARALVGVRFRPHGRDPVTGLDCVGLAALALGVDDPPTGYALRGGAADAMAALVDAAGLVRGPVEAGALLLVESGPAQCHLLVRTADGFVHADAGRRRVVERRGPVPWPVLGSWRAPPVPAAAADTAAPAPDRPTRRSP